MRTLENHLARRLETLLTLPVAAWTVCGLVALAKRSCLIFQTG